MSKAWEFEADETSDGAMFSVYDENGTRVTDPYISEKNAHLVAAARDLHMALELARERVLYLGFMAGNRHERANSQDFLPTIDAALAKAKGDSK